MKHTKGKWYISTRTNKELGVRNASGFIAFLPMPTAYTGQETRFFQETKELEANAKLISKAPEMYDMIKRCQQVIEDFQGTDEIRELLKEIEK